MSSIGFHSPTGEARVSGPELFSANKLCFELFWLSLGISENPLHRDHDPLIDLLCRDQASIGQGIRNPAALKVMLRVAVDDMTWTVGDEQVAALEVVLNTAHAIGQDAVRLMVRLYALGAVHCYVEGANRHWLADIIGRGRSAGLLRTGMGWESAIELLQAEDDSPVVVSHSHGHSFPNHLSAVDEGTWSSSNDSDPEVVELEWRLLDTATQWRVAMLALRHSNSYGSGLELSPASFAVDKPFGSPVAGFDLRAYVDTGVLNTA